MKKLIATAIAFGALCAMLQAEPPRKACECSIGGVCTCGPSCSCGEKNDLYFPLALDLVLGSKKVTQTTTYATLAPPQAASTVGYGCSGGQFVGIGYYSQTTTTYRGSGCVGAVSGGCSGAVGGCSGGLAGRHAQRVADRHARRGW